jgi:hypothetical protein
MTCLTQQLVSHSFHRADCIGSTCMKWSANGELSTLDLALIMERLSAVDANLSVMDACSLQDNPSQQ